MTATPTSIICPLCGRTSHHGPCDHRAPMVPLVGGSAVERYMDVPEGMFRMAVVAIRVDGVFPRSISQTELADTVFLKGNQ